MPLSDSLATLLPGWATVLLTSPLFWIALVAVSIAVMATTSKVVPPHPERRDGSRIFSADQKRSGHDRAGNRCELDMLPGLRCTATAKAADHWFPYSRGGATSMANFVSACTFHNLAKSNHLPTKMATARIESRRRRYFPSGVPTDAGQWL